MPQVQGRWSLTEALFAGAPPEAPARRRAWAELLLERHGIVTRELVRAEGVAGGFAALYEALMALETLGIARRGYFVEGLGGAQFALPAAVERLRGQRDDERAAIVLAATDPAQVYGAALHWPQRRREKPRAATSAPTSCRSGVSPSCSSSAAVGSCRCWSMPATPASTRLCRPSSMASRVGECVGSPSRRSTASPHQRRPTPSVSSTLASAPVRAGSRWPPTTSLLLRRRPLMPEGDTIHYAARRISAVLEGHVPDEILTPHPRFARDQWPERLAGRRVAGVDAVGKHLLIRFEGGLVIHSHLRMHGRWRVVPTDERWRRFLQHLARHQAG